MRPLSLSLLVPALLAASLAGCGTDLAKLISRQETAPVTAVVPLPEQERARPEPRPAAAPLAPAPPPRPAPSEAACQPPPAASGLHSTQGPAAGSGASEQRFAFEEERYLLPGQSDGGLVYVPGAVPAGASVPLVIFLHGTNANGPLHRGLGSGASHLTSSTEIEAGYDLRPVVQELIDRGVIAPVMIGGPSQTREAGRGHDLWPAFDPTAFADAVDRSLGDRARVDRSRLIVVGHSGAGCSPTGGLVGLAQRLGSASEHAPPHALVAIDTCLDEWVCDAFAEATQVTPVWVYYQTAAWERPFEAFRARFLPADSEPPATATDGPERRRVVALEGLSGEGAHNMSLPKALRLALAGLVPPRVCP